MDSLQSLLGHYGSPKEPVEVVAIKRYIADTFDAPASVIMRRDSLIITVANASLAATLRLRIPALQAAANTTARLIFRIG